MYIFKLANRIYIVSSILKKLYNKPTEIKHKKGILNICKDKFLDSNT